MLKRLIAIIFIFCSASVAWMILGAMLVQRTSDSGSSQREKLTALWGSDQAQSAPQVSAQVAVGKHGYETVVVPIRSSRINVKLDLEQRRDGLLWYNLYNVRFLGRYRIRNDTSSRRLSVHFALPSTDGTYADFQASIGGKRVTDPTALDQGCVNFTLPPHEEAAIDIGYRSRGMGTWTYRFGSGVESVNDFGLTMTTNFDAIDFPSQTLPPDGETPLRPGWRLQWRAATLVTGNGIGMAFPYPLQPGPLAQRITFWAPVALFFYFFVMLAITTLRKIDLHPVNYFFLAASFFAFHLLFAYLVEPNSDLGRIRDMLVRHDVSYDLVPAARRRLAVCCSGERARAARLSRLVFVRPVQRRLERSDDHDRRDRHALRSHAVNGTDPLERASCRGPRVTYS